MDKKSSTIIAYCDGFKECRERVLRLIEKVRGSNQGEWYKKGEEAWESFAVTLRGEVTSLRIPMPVLEVHFFKEPREVDPVSFRSFGGNRFIDGKPYKGPVYLLYSDSVIKHGKEPEPEFLKQAWDDWKNAAKNQKPK